MEEQSPTSKDLIPVPDYVNDGYLQKHQPIIGDDQSLHQTDKNDTNNRIAGSSLASLPEQKQALETSSIKNQSVTDD